MPYTLVPLRAVPPLDPDKRKMVSAVVHDINDKGLVVGTCTDDLIPPNSNAPNSNPNPRRWGCHWNVAKRTRDYIPVRGPTLRQWMNECRAINSNGVVVGEREVAHGNQFGLSSMAYACSLTSAPAPTFASLPQGNEVITLARDISATNIVVGSVTLPGQPTQGFIYDPFFNAFKRQAPLPGDASMEAIAITHAGDDTVCLSRSASGLRRLVHIAATGPVIMGLVRSIGRINDQGVVVGSLASNNQEIAFACHLKDKRPQLALLGTLRHHVQSVAHAINAAGVIVGTSTDANGRASAFIYQQGVMRDLNSLVSLQPGQHLTTAKAISDNGLIAGEASLQDDAGSKSADSSKEPAVKGTASADSQPAFCYCLKP